MMNRQVNGGAVERPRAMTQKEGMETSTDGLTREKNAEIRQDFKFIVAGIPMLELGSASPFG